MPVLVGLVAVAAAGAFVKAVRALTKTLSQGPAIEGDTTYDNHAR